MLLKNTIIEMREMLNDIPELLKQRFSELQNMSIEYPI